MKKLDNTALTLASISQDAARLFDDLNKNSPTTPDGFPILTKRQYTRRIANPGVRISAALELCEYYFFRPVVHNKHNAFEIIPWTQNPKISMEESTATPDGNIIANAFKATNCPYMAVKLLARPTEAVFIHVLHPYVQLQWRAQLKALEGDPTNNARTNPVIRRLLTKEGQAAWFVNIAIDPLEETKTRISAMTAAGKLQGHYSEKMRMLHEGLPDIKPQNVTNNLIVGADAANKFRIFLQDTMEGGKLPAPEPKEETVEEADVIDVEPTPPIPDFLR